MASILITGSSGFVGENLARRLVGDGHHMFLCYGSVPPQTRGEQAFKTDLAVRDEFTRALGNLEVSVVVHTAAIVAPDLCEQDPEAAWRVNVEGTREVAHWAASRQARIIYFSTDLVYSGEDGPYTEGDPTGPAQVYGKTKLAGEEEVERSGAAWIIIRLALSYGPTRGRHGEWTWKMRRALAEGKSLPLYTDQIRTPAYVGDTVEAVSRFAQGRGRGLYHVGGSEPVSRYAFGLAFARIFGLPEERFLPVRMEDVTMAAPRPRDCSLDTGKIFREIGLKPCGVEEGLRRQQAEETAAPVIRGTAP